MDDECIFNAKYYYKGSAIMFEIHRHWQERDALPTDLNTFLQDKIIALRSEFPESREVSVGYQANARKVFKKSTGRAYYLKETLMVSDGNDPLANEYIFAPLYQRFLYDRAPEVLLLVEDFQFVNEQAYTVSAHNTSQLRNIQRFEPKRNNKTFAIVSRVFPDWYCDLYWFKKEHYASLEGYEKTLAAMWILGENDYHTSNLGVINQGSAQKPRYVIVKIDHGYSGDLKYNNVEEMIQDMLARLDLGKYEALGQLSVKAEKLKNAIDEMVKISESEIRSLLAKRIDTLTSCGYHVRPSYLNQQTQLILNNIRVVKELSTVLANVLSVKKENSQFTEEQIFEFHNGKWLDRYRKDDMEQVHYFVKYKDLRLKTPPATQTRPQPTFNAQALQRSWHVFSQLCDFSCLTTANIKQGYQLLKRGARALPVQVSQIVQAAIEQRFEIHDCSAIRYAIQHNIQIQGEPAHLWALHRCPNRNQELISMVAREIILHNISCGEMRPITYLMQQNIRIATLTAQEWANKQLYDITSVVSPNWQLVENLELAGADLAHVYPDSKAAAYHEYEKRIYRSLGATTDEGNPMEILYQMVTRSPFKNGMPLVQYLCQTLSIDIEKKFDPFIAFERKNYSHDVLFKFLLAGAVPENAHPIKTDKTIKNTIIAVLTEAKNKNQISPTPEEWLQNYLRSWKPKSKKDNWPERLLAAAKEHNPDHFSAVITQAIPHLSTMM